ncbi:hypothetical protein C8J57DRAFT_1230575 [Mycena rebaudengoi]|nr:hypothetical protein C8J57DRAFT_1230575 [Mycena rebaudengoi]
MPHTTKAQTQADLLFIAENLLVTSVLEDLDHDDADDNDEADPLEDEDLYNTLNLTAINWMALMLYDMLIAVPKAQTEKFPFWADFDPRDQFAHNSLSFSQIELKPS